MIHPVIKRILCVVFALAVFTGILTISIGLPIYIRPFYYAQIEPMDIPAYSGFSLQEIRQAYDAVLDYLTIPGREFSTGPLAHSASGKAHFVDCKVLFDLNATVLVISCLCLGILLILRRKFGPYRLGKRSAAFYGALAAIVIPVVVGGLAATNFDKAFVIFHTIFFPGKENWVFDYTVDPIILILPQDFFMHCAILIGDSILCLSLSVILAELFAFAKRQYKQPPSVNIIKKRKECTQ